MGRVWKSRKCFRQPLTEGWGSDPSQKWLQAMTRWPDGLGAKWDG